MEKENKIYLVVIVLCTIAVVGLCGFAIYNHKDIEDSDAIKFKNEYEAFNGLVNESNDKNYMVLDIDSNNPFVYKTGKEILDVLKEETAIIYFGFASCPWCRNVIEPLVNATKEKKVSKIYYIDIYDIRDTYRFDGNVVPKQTKKGTDAYYSILKFLDKNLDKYYVKDDSGNMYDTGVKRLYAPTVVGVKNGEVVGIHEGTIEAQEDPYVSLTEEEKEELKDKFIEIIDKMNEEEMCDGKDAC